MNEPWLRPVLAELPSYRPAAGLYSAAIPVPLSANESPHEPLPGVSGAIVQAASSVNRYPDPACRQLTHALARARGVAPDNILVGAGSVALLQGLFQAIAEPGAEVIYGWPSFELYPSLAALAGVHSICVPLEDDAFDLHAMAASITSRTRMLLICSPNNPTGTVLRAESLRKFLGQVPSHCLVVLDEAYREYVRDPEAADGLDLVQGHPNLVVLRTFSKAYGLAGLRVGYLIGAGSLVSRLRKALTVYAVSTVAQAAATASLGMESQLLDRVSEIVGERDRIRHELVARNYRLPASQANFLWLPLGKSAADFELRCRRERIAVRLFPDAGVRVTVGTRQENDAFIAAAECWHTGG